MGVSTVLGVLVILAGLAIRTGRVPQIQLTGIGNAVAVVGVVVVVVASLLQGGEADSRLSLASTRAVAGGGAVAVELNCLGGNTTCRGRLTVNVGARRLGSARVSVGAGRTQTATVRLKRRLRGAKLLTVRLGDRALGSVRV